MDTNTTNNTCQRQTDGVNILRDDRMYYCDSRPVLTAARACELVEMLVPCDDPDSARAMIELLIGIEGLAECKQPKQGEELENVVLEAVMKAFKYTRMYQNALTYFQVYELGYADLMKPRDDERESDSGSQ